MLTTIIFDFDGVIIDSFQLCYESFCINFQGVSEKKYRKLFNDNIFKSFDTIKNKQRTKKIDRKKAIDYAHQERLKIAPTEEMKNTIKNLSQKHDLYINTSSHSKSIIERLKKYKLLKFFKEILGADIAKSKVEKFHYLQNKGIKPENIVFITDTAGDIYEAHESNIASIGITGGFHDTETLMKAEPRFLATKTEEILVYIENMHTKLPF